MISRKAADRFRQFVEGQDGSTRPLPLVHTTTGYSFADLCEGEAIEPSMCKNFDKKLIYLFYGRPAYRSESAEFSDLSFAWPIVFVFDPEKIGNIVSVYPFDSGAFFLNLYNRFFSRASRIEDFQLPGSLEIAAKLVSTFYRTESEYLDGRSGKNVQIPPMNYEAEGIQKLAQEPSYTVRLSNEQVTRDERSSAVEVQTDVPIDIKEATISIILPQPFLGIPLVVEALARWGLSEEAIHCYEVIGFHENTSWLGQIYSIVKSVYRKHGFLSDRG